MEGKQSETLRGMVIRLAIVTMVACQSTLETVEKNLRGNDVEVGTEFDNIFSRMNALGNKLTKEYEKESK